MRFVIDAKIAPSGIIFDLFRLIKRYPGNTAVYLSLDTSEGWKTYALGEKVDYCPEFYLAAHDLLGANGRID